jgi:hypothetical protein
MFFGHKGIKLETNNRDIAAKYSNTGMPITQCCGKIL